MDKLKNNLISKLIQEMMTYYSGDARRINHFMKVYGFAKTLGELEGLSIDEQFILEASAVVHDIGIKVSEVKYQSSAGKYQEIEGPGLASQMLEGLKFDEEVITKVCFLVGHHHTYTAINSKEFQLLVEADFLVNCVEEDMSESGIEAVSKNLFKSESGITLLKCL